MLLRAVTSGSKYADLIDEFHKQLETSNETTSALAKYAKTYATTAMTQLAGENNRLFTEDLGAEWFQYVGSVIETSRQFCELLTEKEYIHKSEIKGILNGRIEIDGTVHECEMNAKTGLPKGLIEGTTEDNFQVNVGGWNCRHQLIPISELMVPEHIRAKFDKGLQNSLRLRREVEGKRSEARAVLSKVSAFKEYDVKSMEDAINSGDIASMDKLISEANALYQRFNELVLLGDARKYAGEFTFDELKMVDAAVARTMSSMPTNLTSRESKLKFEISWVEEHKKYPTWKVAKSAYENELSKVKNLLQIENLRKQSSEALISASRLQDSTIKRYASELNEVLTSDVIDVKNALIKLKLLQDKIIEIQSNSFQPATSDIEQKCTPKTLNQLKEELGDKLPATLSKLDEAIKKYEDSTMYGKETAKFKNKIESELRKIFDKHDFGMNIEDSLLEKVLDSHFKNTFEVGGGKGFVGSNRTSGEIEANHARLKAAHDMFGIGTDLKNGQLARNEYEKYGNLLDHDILRSMSNKSDSAFRYGNVQVRFKKDKVLATFTPEDSLNTGYQPTLCSDPKACSYDDSSYMIPKGHTSVSSFTDWRKKHTGLLM